MLKRGIVDPAKVTRSAVENAASIGGMVLTTEVMVTDKPEPKPAMPAMPPGRNGRLLGSAPAATREARPETAGPFLLAGQSRCAPVRLGSGRRRFANLQRSAA